MRVKLVLIVCFTPLLFLPVNPIEKKIIQKSLFFWKNARLSWSMSASANDMMVCPNSSSISFSCIALSPYIITALVTTKKQLMNEGLSFCLNRKSYDILSSSFNAAIYRRLVIRIVRVDYSASLSWMTARSACTRRFQL